MKTKKSLIIKISFIILLIVTAYIFYYPAKYYFIMWLLRDNPKWELDIEIIENMAPHIVSLLEKTYRDTSARPKDRQVAAFGLIKADRQRAEGIFFQYVGAKDNEVVSSAISHLAIAKSIKHSDVVLPYRNSPDPAIRSAVVRYLENVNPKVSVPILRQIMESDPDAKVKSAAKDQLQSMHVIERIESR